MHYDPNALGYDTGRPSGLYWKTTPSTNPATYLFNQGMVSIYALEKIYLALLNEAPRLELSEDLRIAASKSLERMLELAPKEKSKQNAA